MGVRVFTADVTFGGVLFGSAARASNTSHTLSGGKVAALQQSAGVGANWNAEVKGGRQSARCLCSGGKRKMFGFVFLFFLRGSEAMEGHWDS